MAWHGIAGATWHGSARPDQELQARPGGIGHGMARPGAERKRRLGMARRVVAWLGVETQARCVKVGLGRVRIRRLGLAWRGQAGWGSDSQERLGLAWQGVARRGMARKRRLGTARQGTAWPGQETQAWQGLARFGLARHGKDSQAGHGTSALGSAWMRRQGGAWQGQARSGFAGKARPGQEGLSRQGNAGFSFNCFLSMSNYEFRNGAHIKGVTADQAGDELARIYVEKGELTAPLVVDESRPEEAPLHPAFEWDDAIAAERHREHQARNIIRSVKVITEDKPSEPVYVHVSSAQSYKPVAEVVKCVSMYAEALLAATKQVEQAQHALDVLERHCSNENEPIIRDLRLVINNTCDVLKTLATA